MELYNDVWFAIIDCIPLATKDAFCNLEQEIEEIKQHHAGGTDVEVQN